nr:phosphoribosylformylglycinamidine synthase II [Gemmatimonadaceae bacterium]
SAFNNPGDEIVLLGDCSDELGGSEYLAAIHDTVAGLPPTCDLKAEKALIQALLQAIKHGVVSSAHDCSDGGIAVALAECCIMDRSQMFGAQVDLTAWPNIPLRSLLFGETQGRVIISTPDAASVLDIAASHGVPARRLGVVNAAQSLEITTVTIKFSAELTDLADSYYGAIPRAMNAAPIAVGASDTELAGVA